MTRGGPFDPAAAVPASTGRGRWMSARCRGPGVNVALIQLSRQTRGRHEVVVVVENGSAQLHELVNVFVNEMRRNGRDDMERGRGLGASAASMPCWQMRESAPGRYFWAWIPESLRG